MVSTRLFIALACAASWSLVVWGRAEISVLPAVEAAEQKDDRQPDRLRVKHVLIADIGPERIFHAVHRRTAEGERLVGWGRRIVELPFAPAAKLKEVVPARKRFAFSNGGCAMDINGDDIDEIVVARAGPGGRDIDFLWFEERTGSRTWIEHAIGTYRAEKFGVPHDIQPLVLQRSGQKPWRGIVAVIGRQKLVWYEMPGAPEKSWVRHDIGTLPRANQSGLLVGDVSGRGRSDILCGMFWAECPADPRQHWKFHRYGDWDSNGWGGMTKHALADMNGDGVPEIVAAEAEIPNARLGIFEAASDRSKPWRCQILEKTLYCPHSLVVADLDADRRPDIVVGEMTCGGWSFPMNPRPRVLAYVNEGKGKFQVRTIAEKAGIHEMGFFRAQDKLGIVLYGADEIQDTRFKDMRTRINYWRVRPADSLPRP